MAGGTCCMQSRAQLARQLIALLKPALGIQGFAGGAVAALPATQAAAAMRGLRCMASTAPSSTFDSTQVSRAVHARKQLLQRCPLQLFRLRGVTFDGRQEVVKQLKPGQPLQFLQEPSNPADPGAVHVTTLDGCSVGYVAQHLTPAFPLQACFGAVVSVGLAQGTDNWGVSAACSPPLHGLALDLLPASWPQADMQQVFGASGWQQLQQQALSRYQQRCAVTSVPASEVPLQVVPQWRFDHLKQQVQLAELIPLCHPLLQLQQLEAAASTNAEQRAAAVSVLQQVMMWEESECVKFLLYVQQRRQGVEDHGWQLLPPAVDEWLAGATAEE